MNLETSSKITERDLYQYRTQHGVNLGSWFVLEPWISSGPFRFAKEPAQSDLDVAMGSSAKQVLEHHWDNWITDEDWRWIMERGINTVRIPIGYYHLCGVDASVLHGTEFEGLQDIFGGAWKRITHAFLSAHRHGIGVLVDLHAAPGSQNADSHSGTSNHKTNFFATANMAHTIDILRILVRSLFPYPNIVGIELLNEPHPGDHGYGNLKKWYTEAICELRKCDPSLPIYISDCWRTDEYAEFISSLPSPRSMVVLDHHLYRCFTSSDIHTHVSQHTRSLTDPHAAVRQLFERISSKLASCTSAIVVGEWSGALNPGSLGGLGCEVETKARRDYVNAQLALYEQFCAGWFFWTYKKEQPGDRGWSLKDAVAGGVFPDTVGMNAVNTFDGDYSKINSRRNTAKENALGNHRAYWSRYPGKYEHWRFSEGFNRGWDDAYLFFTSACSNEGQHAISELGFRGAWVKRRVLEHTRDKGGGSSIWEFEHGFSQGLDAAKSDFSTVYC